MLDENDELKAGADQADMHNRVEELRAHISETYRLHRRVIRHRRDKVLRADPNSADMPYEVTGRTAAQRLPVTTLTLLRSSPCSTGGPGHGMRYWTVTSRRKAAVTAWPSLSWCPGSAGADDFADALRWRVQRDEAAAERAGLSKREMAMLAAPGLLTTELAVLTELEARLAAGPGDLPSGAVADINALVTAILPGLRSSHRAAIFCGAGSLACRLAARLRQRFSRIAVYGRHPWRQPGGLGDRRAGMGGASAARRELTRAGNGRHRGRRPESPGG